MSRFVPKTGYLLCLPDRDYDRSPGGIYYPDELVRKSTEVLCVLHNPSEWWAGQEERLDMLSLFVEKWNWTDVKLGERDFYLIPEGAVLAVKEGTQMDRKELIATIKDAVEDVVTTAVPVDGIEITEEQLSEVQDSISSMDIVELVDEAETDTDDEGNDLEGPEPEP